MITIFQGRKISLDGTEDQIYANIAVAMRDMLHEFNTGKNLNPFAVFMKIALHADDHGWAFPGRNSIKKGTGLSSDAAIASAIKHLCTMRIDGHRILDWYRTQDPETKQWWWSLYRIFPDAWSDGIQSAPGEFDGKRLHHQFQGATIDNPGVGNPGVGNPPVDNLCYKDNHVEGTPQGKEKGIPSKIENEPKPDILDAMLHYGNREQPENWAVPAAAGGADDWGAAVDAFAGLLSLEPATLPGTTRREWSRVLQKVGNRWKTGPSTVAHVIEKIPESQFHWKTYAGPHSAEQDIGVLIGQFQGGGIQKPKKTSGSNGENRHDRNKRIIERARAKYLLPEDTIDAESITIL